MGNWETATKFPLPPSTTILAGLGREEREEEQGVQARARVTCGHISGRE
jgi:hypothetical protein